MNIKKLFIGILAEIRREEDGYYVKYTKRDVYILGESNYKCSAPFLLLDTPITSVNSN